MAGMRLGRRAPELLALVLAVFGEEFGDLRVVLVRLGGSQILAGLLLEGLLHCRIVEQIGPVKVDLDEGFHRNAEQVAGRILEVVRECREMRFIEVRRLQRRVVLQRLGHVDQEVAREVGVDDVLLDVDHVIDAGLGLHVLDRLVVHLVPGRRLDLDLDAGLLLEFGCQHVLDVVGRRRALGHAMQGDAFELGTGVRPEVGAAGAMLDIKPAARANRLTATARLMLIPPKSRRPPWTDYRPRNTPSSTVEFPFSEGVCRAARDDRRRRSSRTLMQKIWMYNICCDNLQIGVPAAFQVADRRRGLPAIMG